MVESGVGVAYCGNGINTTGNRCRVRQRTPTFASRPFNSILVKEHQARLPFDWQQPPLDPDRLLVTGKKNWRKCDNISASS